MLRKLKTVWIQYVVPALAVVGLTILIKKAFPDIDPTILALLYLVANVLVAVRYGLGPSIFSSVLSVACFDYFFVAPHFTFTVIDARAWLTFAVMIAVTVLISRLTVRSRRSAEKALAAEMEADREKVVSSLLGSVSHDLRTPLTSISGAVSTLLEKDAAVSPKDRKELLEAIQDESTRLNRLVEKILQFTKIESRNIDLHKETHPIEDIVGSALHRLDSVLGDRKVSTDIAEGLSAPMDDLLMGQVLINLIENVVRHTPDGSPIDIHAFQDHRQVWVEIMDRGPGIPIEERVRVFEKFHRIGEKGGWGSGLGLAICQGIVKLHQGRIGVHGRDGGGSVFYFALPLKEVKKEV